MIQPNMTIWKDFPNIFKNVCFRKSVALNILSSVFFPLWKHKASTYLDDNYILPPNRKPGSHCTGLFQQGLEIPQHYTVLCPSKLSQRKAGHPGSNLGNRNPASHTLPDACVQTWQTSSVSPRLSYRLVRMYLHNKLPPYLERWEIHALNMLIFHIANVMSSLHGVCYVTILSYISIHQSHSF